MLRLAWFAAKVWHQIKRVRDLPQFVNHFSPDELWVASPDGFLNRKKILQKVDSFYYLDDKNGYLSNQEPKSSYFLMNDTDGNYEYYSGLYDVHGDRIDDEDDYIFSKTQNGLVSLYNSEHVDYEGFEDYIEIGYLEDPKNGFIFDNDNQQWMRKKDFDKMKSQN
jgi:hypothetical protein